MVRCGRAAGEAMRWDLSTICVGCTKTSGSPFIKVASMAQSIFGLNRNVEDSKPREKAAPVEICPYLQPSATRNGVSMRANNVKRTRNYSRSSESAHSKVRGPGRRTNSWA